MTNELTAKRFAQRVRHAIRRELNNAKADDFSGCNESKQGYISGLQAAIRIMNTTYNKTVDN